MRDKTKEAFERPGTFIPRRAGWLASLGRAPGSRVAAPVEKSPEGLMAYLVVPELPRNPMGKVQKNVLREQHRAAFS